MKNKTEIYKELDRQVEVKNKSYFTTEKSLINLSKKETAQVPAKLARTSLFTTKTKNFITDSDYSKMFKVNNYSIAHVSGRELGVQHRLLSMSLFKLKHTSFEVDNPFYDPEDPLSKPTEKRYRVITSWREILTSMGLTIHKNNVATILKHLQDMKKVVITVLDGSPESVLDDFEKGIIPKGHMSNVIHEIKWESTQKKTNYDDKVVIEFGEYTNAALENKDLANIDMSVLLSLKKSYAISIWPFINSHLNRREFLMEETIAELVNFDLENSDKEERKAFRRYCKEAFAEIKKIGGVEYYTVERVKKGNRYSYKYWYVLKIREIRYKFKKLIKQLYSEDKFIKEQLEAIFLNDETVTNDELLIAIDALNEDPDAFVNSLDFRLPGF
tara:strand:- start:2676 stop:3833 length:1158 start_codon:yes stop_codon:yes gene_type:complete